MCAVNVPAELTRSVLDALVWRCIGPHRGGRVVAVAGDVSDPMTFYFGACAGGVWKTTDGGQTWRCVSDGYFTTAAIGALAVSPSHPNVVYAGTGETSIRNNVSHGDGVYRSLDGGQTWQHVGLRDTRHIGRILIHPEDPNLVYVAALGHAFGPNAERGVFRSRDGGATWEKVLFKSEQAGSHDIAMDPTNPRRLYAAIWQTRRYPHTLDSGGPESGLWRSTDGGDTWTEITGRVLAARKLPADGSPPPATPKAAVDAEPTILGKIGVAASPEPVPGGGVGRVWALVEAEDGALFRSDDGGETWLRVNEESKLRTRPWYYMHITADPRDAETVWVQNYRLWKSVDGGRTFQQVPTPHGDDHALWIDPNHTERMIEGNDGGACVTFNGGVTWTSIYNQPTAQLYHVTTDDRFPYYVYGSQQDNTAIGLPSCSVLGAIQQRDWVKPGGGESGYIAVKPDDPQIVVASGPIGRRAPNDLMLRYDGRTGQELNVTVWPELYGWGVGAESLKHRFNWTFPILFSQHDPNLLYCAAERVFRSTDLGASWEPISDDLTRNDPTKLGPSGGPVTRDNTGAEVYCTIFALAESPKQAGLFWAGTDDGLVHVSEDGCRTWRNVTPPDLPEWALISIIEPSPHDPATAYVAATRYKLDDTRPYLYKTNDYGRTWTRIVEGIPDGEFTRMIREDPNRRGLLYAGTETGLYVSFDDGAHWQRLNQPTPLGSSERGARQGGALPICPIHDLVIKGVELVVATHGRSFWILDDPTPLHQLGAPSEAGAPSDAAGPVLFRPRDTVRLRIMGGFRGPALPGFVNFGRSGTNGFSVLPTPRPDGTLDVEYLDAGQNPPDGVALHYYLPAAPRGAVTLAILDADGRELRRFTGAGEAVTARPGVNRFVWNRRLPGVPNVTGADLDPWHRPDGPLVLPGRYAVRLSVDGEELTQEFEILPDPRITASRSDLEAQLALLLDIRGALETVNTTLNRIDALRTQLDLWQRRLDGREGAEGAKTALAEVQSELGAIRGALIDVNMRQAQLWPSGLHEKLNALFDVVDSADAAPPRQTRELFEKLAAELGELTARFERVHRQALPALNRALGEAGLEAVGVDA